jgi:hypothetical protein
VLTDNGAAQAAAVTVTVAAAAPATAAAARPNWQQDEEEDDSDDEPPGTAKLDSCRHFPVAVSTAKQLLHIRHLSTLWEGLRVQFAIKASMISTHDYMNYN